MRAHELLQGVERDLDQPTFLEPEQTSVLEDELPLRCRGDGVGQVADVRAGVLEPGGWAFFRVDFAAVELIVHFSLHGTLRRFFRTGGLPRAFADVSQGVSAPLWVVSKACPSTK